MILSLMLHRGETQYYSRTIDMLDNRVESLSYPLFFQAGENGWGLDMSGDGGDGVSTSAKSGVTFMNYLAYRILCPEYDQHGHPFMCQAKHRNEDGTVRLIHTNRFQVL